MPLVCQAFDGEVPSHALAKSSAAISAARSTGEGARRAREGATGSASGTRATSDPGLGISLEGRGRCTANACPHAPHRSTTAARGSEALVSTALGVSEDVGGTRSSVAHRGQCVPMSWAVATEGGVGVGGTGGADGRLAWRRDGSGVSLERNAQTSGWKQTGGWVRRRVSSS